MWLLVAVVAALLPIRGAAVAQEVRVTGAALAWIERSVAGLEGTAPGATLGVQIAPDRRLLIAVEAGGAKFMGSDQEGHRDILLSGLVGLRLRSGRRSPTLFAGPTWLHSQLHSNFPGLATNRLAFTVGIDWPLRVTDRVRVGPRLRFDLADGIQVIRPALAASVGF